MKRSIIIKSIMGAILVVCLAVALYVVNAMAAIPNMFRLNGQAQAEGYFTGEFEFKLLGCAYYLDHGQYVTAFSRLSQLREQMETRKGLIKVPKFADKKAEMDFYLSLQNPKTGAFMDDSYPAIFYYEPSENVIDHLEELAKATGQPIHLRYPMRFMDQFDTLEELTAALDDLSRVGWIGAKLPKTTFVLASQFSSSREYEDLGGYKLDPGYEKALLQWFSDNQDPASGTWGPRDRNSGRLIYPDLNSTYRVIKLFLDDKGKERYAEFPLQHRKELFASILQELSAPMPDDLSSAEVHDWTLSSTKSVKLMTRDLWKTAGSHDRARAYKIMTELVRSRYEKFYPAQEGAFVYYPDTESATLDGTGSALALLNNVGALSEQARDELWGKPAQTIKNRGEYTVSAVSKDNLSSIHTADINSIRVYANLPEDSLSQGTLAIIYPQPTVVLDTADLMPRIDQWLQDTPQSMGNWTTWEQVHEYVEEQEWTPLPVCQVKQELVLTNELLKKNGQVVLVGFDTLQIPRCSITFKLAR